METKSFTSSHVDSLRHLQKLLISPDFFSLILKLCFSKFHVYICTNIYILYIHIHIKYTYHIYIFYEYIYILYIYILYILFQHLSNHPPPSPHSKLAPFEHRDYQVLPAITCRSAFQCQLSQRKSHPVGYISRKYWLFKTQMIHGTGIFPYMKTIKNQPNVGKYTIHGMRMAYYYNSI